MTRYLATRCSYCTHRIYHNHTNLNSNTWLSNETKFIFVLFEFRTVKFTVAHSIHDLFSLAWILRLGLQISNLILHIDCHTKFSTTAIRVNFHVPQVSEIWAQSSNLGLDLRLHNTASHITGARADRQEQERAAAPAKSRFSYLFRMEIANTKFSRSASNLECSLRISNFVLHDSRAFF